MDRQDKSISDEQAEHLCKEIDEKYLLHCLGQLCDNGGWNLFAMPSVSEWFLSESGKNLFLPALRLLDSGGYQPDFGTAYWIASTVFVKVSLESGKPVSRPQDLMPAVFAAIDRRQLQREQNYIHDDSGQEVICDPYEVRPRRIWDINSNRVIPFAFLEIKKIEQDPNSQEWKIVFSSSDRIPAFWAVSHSWMDSKDLTNITTMANGKEWPVPLPTGVSLEQVRRELLGLGGRYIWLDVLCLRQHHTESEQERRRTQEWKLDVPTIGNIYRIASTTVRYFNGLGRRFSTKGWDDKRHWLQRAWTLQEVRSEDITYNAGVHNSVNVLNTRGIFEGRRRTLREVIAPIWELARHIEEKGHAEIYRVVKEMQRRSASNSLDRLCGLFYLLRTIELPTYTQNTSTEDAWKGCFHVLPEQTKLEIFFDFPSGGTDSRWFPSWEQLLDWPERNPALEHRTRQFSGELEFQERAFPSCIHYENHNIGLLYLKNIFVLPYVFIQKCKSSGEYTIKTSEIGVDYTSGRTRLTTPKTILFQSVYSKHVPIKPGVYTL